MTKKKKGIKVCFSKGIFKNNKMFNGVCVDMKHG